MAALAPPDWHTLPALIFAGLHWGMREWLKWTGQEHEWWAPVVTNFLATCFVLTFIFVLGSEAFIECWEAVAGAVQRIRRR